MEFPHADGELENRSGVRCRQFGKLALEAGLPPGVFSVVPGFGHTAGKALAQHMDVDCVAFTGSTATGKLIMQYTAQSNLKRVGLECGGKSPNIVMADYQDLDRAAMAAAYGIFFNQGEMCSAGSRLLVYESLREPLLERVIALAKQFVPGDPLDEATQLGAIVDQAQMERVLGYVDAGRMEGMRVALRAGTVYINCYDADNITVPFGGYKQSGMGRDKSLHAFDKYTELKSTWLDLV